MPRARSTGGSPAKKSGKTPARHTTPRKKSKTPRKAKSPAAKRGRSRSVSKSRAASPKKPGRKTPAKKSPGRKSLSKSPSTKTTPTRTPRRSRSRSQNKANARRTPSVGQKIKDVAQVIEHKVATPIQSFASSLRSRRAAHDRALDRLGGPSYVTSAASRRQPVGQSLIQRVRNCRFANCFSGIRRRVRWNAVKRHLKKNWTRYAILVAAAAGAYYSYQNKKYLEKVVNEQYNKLSELIQQQKGSAFSKYFSG